MLWSNKLVLQQLYELEMVTGRAAPGQVRAWTSRPAGLTGLKFSVHCSRTAKYLWLWFKIDLYWTKDRESWDYIITVCDGRTTIQISTGYQNPISIIIYLSRL